MLVLGVFKIIRAKPVDLKSIALNHLAGFELNAEIIHVLHEDADDLVPVDAQLDHFATVELALVGD